jgi:hypothetical protein
LLGFNGEIVEAGFTLECLLLLGEGHVAVAGHPLREMLLILAGVS